MTRRYKARTTTIVQDGGAKSWSKKQSTKKVFPVEVTYKEPSSDLGLLLQYEASLSKRQPVGPKGGRLRSSNG